MSRVGHVGDHKLPSAGPAPNLPYANIRNEGLHELGGDGFGLKACSQTVERWQAGAGLRAGRDWVFVGGRRLSVQAHLLWPRAFSMRGDALDASFAVLDPWPPVGGIGLSRYGGDAGLSVDWALSRRSSLSPGMDD